MVLWLVFGVMAVMAVGFVAVPLLRRAPREAMPERADYDLAVYKDQLRDIERDRMRGALDEEQAAAASLEVERRLLATASAAPEVSAPQGPSALTPWHLAVIVALILIPAAGLIYLHQGAPWFDRDRAALLAREQGGQQQFAALIAELERRLAAAPDDRRGWVLLARGYARQGRMAEAEVAQQRAMALAADDGEAAEIAAGFGQVLIEEAQGAVTPAARAALAEALKRNPAQAQARYFTGLAKLQDGDAPGALADWRALLADTPPEAPWREGLEEQIARLGSETAAPADPAARQAMIESMVAGLAARLEETRASGGGTAEEWAQLGRSYRVLGRAEAARDAYGEAIKRKPDDVALLRDYAAVTAEATGDTSEAYRTALGDLRDRLPMGSTERATIEQQLKKF
jgi:cytochrome c-type biogenesis protein CcmH